MNNSDFLAGYNAGKQIFIDPSKLYTRDASHEDLFFNMPSFAVFLSITFSLIPNKSISNHCFHIFILFLAILSVIEYNKILFLMGLDKKKHRFLFLMIVSNGMIIYNVFYLIQYKHILGLVMLFIIRREIQYRQDDRIKSLKFYLLHYGLFAFAVGTFPPSIFILLIYIFHDIPIRDLFRLDSIKKYSIVIFMFLIQNFLFFIYPSLIFDFLGGFNKHNTTQRSYIPLFYLREWKGLYSTESNQIIFMISVIYISIITIILILNKNLLLEERYAYFAFACIIFFTYAQRMFVMLLPLAILVYISFLKQKDKTIDLIKENKIITIGLLSIVGIYFMLPDFTIYKYFPVFQKPPLVILMYARYIVLLIGYVGSVLILHLKKYNFKEKIDLS